MIWYDVIHVEVYVPPGNLPAYELEAMAHL